MLLGNFWGSPSQGQSPMVHIGERKVESKWLTKVCAEMLSTHVNEQHGDPRAMA